MITAKQARVEDVNTLEAEYETWRQVGLGLKPDPGFAHWPDSVRGPMLQSFETQCVAGASVLRVDGTVKVFVDPEDLEAQPDIYFNASAHIGVLGEQLPPLPVAPIAAKARPKTKAKAKRKRAPAVRKAA